MRSLQSTIRDPIAARRPVLFPLVAAAILLTGGFSLAQQTEPSDGVEDQRAVTEEPLAEQPAGRQPAANQPRAESPASDQPTAERPVLNDEDIAMALMMELASEQPGAFDNVQVSVKDGVVTLAGNVEHLLAKQRAAAIARTFKGVVSVINRLEIELEPRSDQEIQGDVVAALQANPATDSIQIDVEVQDGVVTLSGNVDSHAERLLAVQAARGVRGVRQIVNRLALDYQEERSDEEIAADVRGRLKWDVWVDETSIDVAVEDGVVTLAGAVGSMAEKFRARVDAWVAGVEEVQDELEVQWWADDRFRREQPTEALNYEEVRQRVVETIRRDPRVDAEDLQIHVKAGEVTLLGSVSSIAGRQAAEEDARNTVGVALVSNQLTVRRPEGLSDTEINHAVGQALTRDPYVSRHQITVSVTDGVATLAGMVPSPFDRQRAAAVAATVRGVVEVKNEIEVENQEDLTDEELAGRIRRRLMWSPYVEAQSIDVMAADGVVTLTGTADSRIDVHTAMQIARQSGATQVINQIELQTADETPAPQ